MELIDENCINLKLMEFVVGSNLEKVINGELTVYGHKYCNPQFVETILKKTHDVHMVCDDDHINGWQADAWYDLIVDGEPFTVEGCAYSGGMRFYKKDDDE